MAKDNLYVMSERERERERESVMKLLEKTNHYAAYLEENTGYGVYYSTQL